MDALFKTLGLTTPHPGVCLDAETWYSDPQQRLLSINPADESVIGEVHTANATHLETLITSSQEAATLWQTWPAPKRGELIRELGLLFRQHKASLGRLIAIECGKSLAEGEGEVQEMIDMADLAVGQSRMLYGYTMASERPQHRLYEQWQPLGTVGVITAFNFPMAVWSWNALLAAICGNSVIWKPSSKTPFCAIAIQHLCNQITSAMNAPPIFNLCITPDNTLAEHLVDDARVSLISFTGSSAVGKHLYQRVAARMGRCLLECSGNNAVIVDDSASLELAIPAIVFGAVGTAGQRCTTTRRALIHESIYSQVVSALKHAYQQLKIGNPIDPSIHMGPLIDAKAVSCFQKTVKAAQAAGGELCFGGDLISGAGYYVQPTLIHAQNHWPVVQEENFVPILYLISCPSFESAVADNNAVPQGLSSACFTNTLRHAEYFLSSMGSDCGLANINTSTSGAEIGGAFGGEKTTGGGREAGSDAWKNYMRRQTVTINAGKALPLAQGIQFST